MATTPSRPMRSSLSNQAAASSGSSVCGVSRTVVLPTGRCSDASSRRVAARRERRSASGAARRSSPFSARRSNATNDAGISAGELLDPRLRRVEPQLQRVEVQTVLVGQDHLAVHDAAGRERFAKRRDQLREVALQRPRVAALDPDIVALAEDDRPEPVPLRLVPPPVTARDLAFELRQHRGERRSERQRLRRWHGQTLPPERQPAPTGTLPRASWMIGPTPSTSMRKLSWP